MTINQTQKGVKGFLKIASNLKKTERYSYKMNKAESNAINEYCNTHSITKAEMFRSALHDFYNKNNININEETSKDPNQLRLD